MKRLLFVFLLLSTASTVKAQFPTTDSLRGFINKWIRNSAVEAFQNLRLNTALIGMTNFTDSAYNGQVKSFTALNDTTVRLITLADDTLDVVVRGAAITSLNGLTASEQTFATGTTGTDFNISSATATHTFNIPDASTTARGLITTGTQTIAGDKAFTGSIRGASDNTYIGVDDASVPRMGFVKKTGSIPFIGIGSGNPFKIAHSNGGDITPSGTFTDRFILDGTGNISIGASNPSSKLDIQTNALGTTQTNTSGLLLSNTTEAASAAQQISPAIRWRGNGWKTDATAASQPVDFRADVLPVQGTSSPTGVWRMQAAVNDGAYSTRLQVASNAITGEFMSTGLRIAGAGLSFGGGTPVANNINWGSSTFNISPHSTVTSAINVLTFSGVGTATSDTTNWIRFNPTFQPTSGSGLFRSVIISPTINQTGGANGKTHGILIDPTLTSAADFRAIETVRGNAIFGTTSGNVLIGTSVDSGFKLDVTGNIRGTGSLELSTASEGVILKSPNGTRYKLTVENDGTLTTTAL